MKYLNISTVLFFSISGTLCCKNSVKNSALADKAGPTVGQQQKPACESEPARSLILIAKSALKSATDDVGIKSSDFSKTDRLVEIAAYRDINQRFEQYCETGSAVILSALDKSAPVADCGVLQSVGAKFLCNAFESARPLREEMARDACIGTTGNIKFWSDSMAHFFCLTELSNRNPSCFLDKIKVTYKSGQNEQLILDTYKSAYDECLALGWGQGMDPKTLENFPKIMLNPAAFSFEDQAAAIKTYYTGKNQRIPKRN